MQDVIVCVAGLLWVVAVFNIVAGLRAIAATIRARGR